MPAQFDKCVRDLMADPDFKPKKEGQSKKDAAYAVCTASYKKAHGKNPMASAQYVEDVRYSNDRTLSCLSTIIYNSQSMSESLGYDREYVQDEETKTFFGEAYQQMQDWIIKAATIRKRLYPSMDEVNASKTDLDDLSLAELMQRDPELRLTVLLLDNDKEIKRLNGSN